MSSHRRAKQYRANGRRWRRAEKSAAYQRAEEERWASLAGPVTVTRAECDRRKTGEGAPGRPA